MSSPHGSPSAPRKRTSTYGDRFIPTRPSRDSSASSSGVDLASQFQLMASGGASAPGGTGGKGKRRASGDGGKDEQDATFRSLLQTELFGPEVPTASTSSLSLSSLASSRSSHSRPVSPSTSRGGSSAHPPSTPRSNTRPLFNYSSPSRSRSSHHASEVNSNGSAGAKGLDSPTHEKYATSPVRWESQRMLLSARKTTRTLSKVPFKVLDAPDLQDDYYLNLVDWSSTNVLGVGLGPCVYLWSAPTGKVTKLCDLAEEGDSVTSLGWVGQGNHLALGTKLGHVHIYDAATASRVRKMSGHSARVGALAWKDHVLSSGSHDKTILHRDVRAAAPFVAKLTAHKQEVCGLKWSDAGQLASGGNDNKLFVWQGMETSPTYRFTEHVAAIKAISWNPHQGGILASGGGTADMKIRFWNTLTGSLLSEIDTGSQICNLLWSKNSNELVSTHGFSTGAVQNQIAIWKYPSQQQIATLTGHSYRVLYLAMSPDGQTIVTGAGDETLRFWHAFPGSRVDKAKGQSTALNPFVKIR